MKIDWSNVGETLLAGGLPILGGVLGGPAGAGIGTLVAQALGVKATPEAVQEVVARDPEAMVKLRALELKHQEELEKLYVQAKIESQKATNETYRTEIASNDAYVRRMRPTFGYLVALCLAAQVMAGVYVVGWDPMSMPLFAQFITALNVPMATALAVLGVYVNGRSKEKAMDFGVAPGKGLIARLLDK